MQTNPKQINLTKQHLQILEYTDTLFSRWSLRKNAYLFKHLKSNLQIPLYIIAEQRRITQITQNQTILIQALKLSQFADVNQQTRMIKILDLPTVKVTDQANLLRIQNIVKNYIKQKANQDKINSSKPIQYTVSPKTDDGHYYIVIKLKGQKQKNLLKNLIQKHNKSQPKQKIAYSQQPMYEDIKDGVNKFRKNKRQYMQNNQSNQQKYGKGGNYYNNNTYETDLTNPVYSKQNMMMMYPGVYYPTYSTFGVTPQQMQYQMQQQKVYHTFIRKAVDSNDQDQNNYQDNKKKKYQQKVVQKKQQKQQQQQTQQIVEKQKKVQQQKQTADPKNIKNQQQTNANTQNGNKSTNTNNNDSAVNKKSQNKGNKNKKNHHNNNNNKDKDKQRQKQQQKTKIVLDDNDFPTIG